MSFGMVFTALHGYLNAKWFSEHGHHLNNEWFSDPRFLMGFIIYEFGYWVTIQSEYIMRNLRDPNDTKGPRYKIPRGGAFEYVSSPQYAAELVAWTGFAIMTWGPGGLIVLTISMANLIPRAFKSHTWYQEKFGDEYPQNRKVIIPFIL
jgi:3-oxo-5-alpha-steroid 4-dehydrogenase 1